MKRIVFVLAIALTTLAACKNGKTETSTDETAVQTSEQKSEAEKTVEAKELENIETFTIASHREDCTGVVKMKCLLVKKGDGTEWEFFYSPIEGFNYEEGFEYKLEVRTEEIENPPADSSSVRYILVNEISKEKK